MLVAAYVPIAKMPQPIPTVQITVSVIVRPRAR